MIEQLKRFRLFEEMTNDELGQIAGHCTVRKVEKGTALFASEDPAEFLFLVAKGGVDLCCRVSYKHAESDVSIDHISEGDALGWSALTPPFRYHLAACAAEDTELIQIDRHALDEICRGDPAIGYKLMKNTAAMIGRRVAALQETVRDLIQQGLKDKESST
ncbi:MAG: hypothetical protein Kow0092_13380 [Deferrisomatales bacterium]